MDKFYTANKSLIKDINTSTILQIVRSKGPISRAEISKLTRLNPATVSSNVGALIDSGFVRETGIGASSGGRKPMMIELNPDAYYTIGVDMGTTDVSAGITDLEGKIHTKVTLPFPSDSQDQSPETILGILKASIREVQRTSGIADSQILGIGMGIHGLVDPHEGISLYAPAFRWEDVPISVPFSEVFQLPVSIENDARAMALGEKWFGQATSISNFVFLNIGTGIGSGIYVNGELLQGAHHGAGEIGHLPLEGNKELCFCGKSGCLSTLASGPAIERAARSGATQGKAPYLMELVGGSPQLITGEMVSEAAGAGDPYSLQLLHETGRNIGTVLAPVVNLLNPEMVLIGGGVSNSWRFLEAGLRESLMEKAMAHNLEQLHIGPTALGDDCGIIGAAALIVRSVFSNPNQYQSI